MMNTVSGGKILIVEDEKNLGLTLQEYLSNKGFECKWSDKASEALEQISEPGH